MLVALAARTERRPRVRRLSGEHSTPTSTAEVFHLHRQARSQRARTLGALLVPLVRLGGKMAPLTNASLDLAALTHSPLQMFTHTSAQLGLLAGQALLAWLVLAIPVAALLTLTLTGVLRRVPALAEAGTKA